MKVLIIEDEKPAAEKLKKAVLQYDAHIQIDAVLKGIGESLEWFQQNPEPDLVFMDIQLTDGLSFRIFDKITIHCPVIFTTAYDDYWQQAFEQNSIDYLLKPIKQEKLEGAMKKYHLLKKHFNAEILKAGLSQAKDEVYKKRFLVKRGTEYVSVPVHNVAYLHATHKLVCLVLSDGQKYILDESLAELESQLDPGSFFRLNRKYLVNLTAIKKMKAYPKSRIAVELTPAAAEEIVISQENSGAFKDWMDR